ncbi:hypothetical protein OB994_00125 [Bacillus cereus]|nr:hypothetical protein [Bacillus cereus]
MKYNDGLKTLHCIQRKETIQELQNAIQMIKTFEGEDTSITAKKITDNSNLSRAVLYKEHLLQLWHPTLWQKNQEARKQTDRKLESKYKNNITLLTDLNNSLTEELSKANMKIQKLSKELEISNSRAITYKADYEEEKIKYQRQLGENQRLYDRLYSQGLNEPSITESSFK